MSQRDEDPARPLTTGEFRAAPDASANTAQFRAWAAEGEAEAPPWEMKAPARNIGRLIGLAVLIAIVLAVLAVLVIKL